MAAVRALQTLILILVAVAGFEIGTLRRPQPPPARIVFIDSAPVEPAARPSPVGRDPEPEPEPEPEPAAVAAADPPPAPRPRPRHRQGPIPGTGSVADCAQNGGPLCGMPE